MRTKANRKSKIANRKSEDSAQRAGARGSGDQVISGFKTSSLQSAELLFAQAGLLEDFPESSGGQCPRMHGDVGLSSVGMAENFVASGLASFYEARAKEFGQNLTGRVGHREFRRERSGSWFRSGCSRRGLFFLRSRLRSALLRPRALHRRPGHASSNRVLEHARNNSLEIRARSRVREIRSSA